MVDTSEQSPAGIREDKLEIERSEPYWIKAGRVVDDVRALADKIEATIEPGKLTGPYGPVVDHLDELLGEVEMAALEVEDDDQDEENAAA